MELRGQRVRAPPGSPAACKPSAMQGWRRLYARRRTAARKKGCGAAPSAAAL